MTRRAIVHRISASAPDDVSGIEAAIASQRIDPKGVIAVLAKTEGNGLVNDFSRGHASLALSLLFKRHLATTRLRGSASSCLEAPKAPWLPIGWCSSALDSAGIELINHEIVVMGMSPSWSGPLSIDHAVMGDAIDVEPVRAALKRLGLDSAGQLPPAQRGRLVALLGKAEASDDGQLRGHRHTMLDDSDIAATRHARAFVCGALAALVGHAEIYVSGGAEHQGPDGGGPVALIVDRAAS